MIGLGHLTSLVARDESVYDPFAAKEELGKRDGNVREHVDDELGQGSSGLSRWASP